MSGEAVADAAAAAVDDGHHEPGIVDAGNVSAVVVVVAGGAEEQLDIWKTAVAAVGKKSTGPETEPWPADIEAAATHSLVAGDIPGSSGDEIAGDVVAVVVDSEDPAVAADIAAAVAVVADEHKIAAAADVVGVVVVAAEEVERSCIVAPM